MFDFYDGLNDLFNDLKKIEKEKNIKIVMVSVIKGMETGIKRYFSDVDLRVCFFFNDFSIPEENDPNFLDLIHFTKTFNDKPYDCISFWEVHYFFGFLSCPVIGGDIKYPLTSSVYETIFSPFVIDFLGLRDLLMDDLNIHVNSYFEKNIIEEKLYNFTNEEDDKLVSTFKAFHNYLRLKWMNNEGGIAPYSLNRLVSVASEQEKDMFNLLQEEMLDFSLKSKREQDKGKDTSLRNVKIKSYLREKVRGIKRTTSNKYVPNYTNRHIIFSKINYMLNLYKNMDYFWMK